MTALFSRRAADADALLRRALPGADRRPVIGVEHEFAAFRGDRQVDFREVVHEIGLPGRALHPTNPFQYLTPDGGVILADGAVAEIATPPLPSGPGAATAAAAWAEHLGAQLRDRAPADLELHGGSTHLNISTPADLNDRLGFVFARTLAPALMLLVDQPHSPGLLVRPRPGRLEFGGEYVVGDALTAAMVFATGAVGAVEAGLRGDAGLPSFLDVELQAARRRHGWYVDRRAFGDDLYAHGRAARLPLVGGRTVTAGAWLAAAWEYARPHAGAHAGPDELELVDAVVDGSVGLPMERGLYGVVPDRIDIAPSPIGVGARTLTSPIARLTPVAATWDWAAWEADTPDGPVVVSIPRAHLDGLERVVERGALDPVLLAAGPQRASLPVLSQSAQTLQPGIFSAFSAGPGVLPHDRMGVGNAPVSAVRPAKRGLPEDRSTSATSSSAPRAARAVAALAMLASVAALFALAAGSARAGSPSPGGGAIELFVDGPMVLPQGDGVVPDPPGDQLDYYGLFDPSGADATKGEFWRVDVADDVDLGAQLDRFCSQGTGDPADMAVCPPGVASLATAPSLLLVDVELSRDADIGQAGLIWTDPSRPTWDGPEGDPNSGRNTSFDVFLTADGYEVGQTFFDGEFAFGTSDHGAAVVRPDGVSLLLDPAAVGSGENTAIFIITPYGLDLIAVPDEPAGTILLTSSAPTSSTTSSSTTSSTSSTTTTLSSAAPEDASGSTSTPPSTPTGGDGGGDDGGGSAIWWLLILLGLGLVAAGWFLFRRDDGEPTSTFPIATGFEKGSSGSAAVRVG